ncbi:MAG: hypothetical protein GY862_22895 [Gammaproteobacteria bacterium]|nr:hypothetical protein [Gammaproteobacteria bacterium]
MTNDKNHALGAVLGACIGDAAGATLEFLGRKPTAEEVKEALAMPGGGVWRVAPGQITDDGELTLCLARSLTEKSKYDIELAADYYAAWIESEPFDIGMTTMRSLGAGTNHKGKGRAALMRNAAQSRRGVFSRIHEKEGIRV